MEIVYREIGRETGTNDPRAIEIAALLCRLKVLSYSWGKIHIDEVIPLSQCFIIICAPGNNLFCFFFCFLRPSFSIHHP